MWNSDPHQVVEAPSDSALTCELQRLVVRSDGYTKAGDYFGTAGIVYYVSGDVEGCIRAPTKASALFKLRARWPLLREEGKVYKDPDLGWRLYRETSGDCAGIFVPRWPRSVFAHPIPAWLSDNDVTILGSLSWRASLGYQWDPDVDCMSCAWTYTNEATDERASGDGVNPYRGERDTQGA